MKTMNLQMTQSVFRYVKCSKGTYIRTLAVMIGEKLGYPAHMSKLVRTSTAGISQEICLTFDEIEEHVKNNEWDKLFTN